MDIDALAERVFAYEKVDSCSFRRQLRILQSIWRIEHDYPVGTFRGRPLGSLLAMPWAQEHLANFLDETIRQVVRQEVLDPVKSRNKLYGRPRIFNNLLSSQPLAFNLFGHLQSELDLATKVFRQLSNGRCQEITGIEFEYSPGRGDSRYTEDGSAFDVFVTYLTQDHQAGFVGIEVKYHEDLANPAGRHRKRYDDIAGAIGCFKAGALDQLKGKPLQQIWRDHLLACSLVLEGEYKDGFFVFLSPQANDACNDAVASYEQCLTSSDTFMSWSIEACVNAILDYEDASWVRDFQDRYLNLAKLETFDAGEVLDRA